MEDDVTSSNGRHFFLGASTQVRGIVVPVGVGEDKEKEVTCRRERVGERRYDH